MRVKSTFPGAAKHRNFLSSSLFNAATPSSQRVSFFSFPLWRLRFQSGGTSRNHFAVSAVAPARLAPPPSPEVMLLRYLLPSVFSRVLVLPRANAPPLISLTFPLTSLSPRKQTRSFIAAALVNEQWQKNTKQTISKGDFTPHLLPLYPFSSAGSRKTA